MGAGGWGIFLGGGGNFLVGANNNNYLEENGRGNILGRE